MVFKNRTYYDASSKIGTSYQGVQTYEIKALLVSYKANDQFTEASR